MRAEFRRLAVRVAWLGIGWLGLVGRAGAGELRPMPRPEGATMPKPPQQGEPWTPPEAAVPRFLVRAAATLFEQGLADPRGCEYREVELPGEAGLFKTPTSPRPTTHAWVLPADAEGRARYAIGWNGLVYPLTALGDPAELEADVRSILKAAAEIRAAQDRQSAASRNLSDWNSRYFRSEENLQSVIQGTLTPAKVCLLLRLGRADLAGEAWEAGTGRKPEVAKVDLTAYGVSYLTLASDWTWALFDRAVAAHGRRDDPLALADARELARIRPLIEAKAEAMGFPRPQAAPAPDGTPAPYLGFLKLLPALLADQERRAQEQRKPRPLAELEQIPDRAARVGALIARLDETGGRLYDFGIGQDETVQAIVREGDAAIGPLLDAFERDDRLTRSYRVDERRHSRYRQIVPVHQLAYQALVQVLGTNQFAPGSVGYYTADEGPEKRKEIAATIRAYAEKFRGVSPENRWFRTLADDGASLNQWTEASGKIVQPAGPPKPGSRRARSWNFGPSHRRYDEKVPLRGDPLRARANPTVSALLIKRIDALARPDSPWKPGDGFPLHAACTLALDLAHWDPEAARPVLASMARRCRRETTGETQSHLHYTADALGAYLAQLTDARAQLGDAGALDEYAGWLRSLDPEKFPNHGNLGSIFGPMEDYPDHPSIASAAEWLFNDPASPWLPWQGDAKHPNAWALRDPLTGSPMLGLAGFRKLVVRLLADRSAFGSARLDERGYVTYRIGSGGQGGGGLAYVEPDGPHATPETPMRICDYHGWKLSGWVDGIPPCMPYWPEDRRDRALADQVAFLNKYGERFAASPLRDRLPERIGVSRLAPTFPPLDHPATADEVRRGLAIFSMEGQGEARTVPLPERPLAAAWVTLKDYAFMQQSFDTKTSTRGDQVAYDRDGLVWQAEEVREGGRWRRYYGFAGRRLARVPAEEVEFPGEWYRWGALSNRLDAQVSLPPPPEGSDPTVDVFPAGRPLVATVRLRNRAGLGREVPTDYLRRDEDGPPSLRAGVTLTLARAADVPPGEPPRSPPAWEDLTPRPIARFEPGGASRVLDPAESFEAFRLDLNALFDLDRPGTFRLRAAFAGGSGVAEGTSNEVTFRLLPPAER